MCLWSSRFVFCALKTFVICHSRMQVSGAGLLSDTVMWVELAAAGLFFLDAILYFRVWCLDAWAEREEEEAHTPVVLVGHDQVDPWLYDDSCDLVFAQCHSAEMQEHLWNLLGSLVYVISASIGVILQLTTYRNDPFASGMRH
jgi:hypothetical protein